MAEQTEKAFLKRPTVFLSSNKSGKKDGNRFWKSIGLGFKTPRKAIEGISNVKLQVACVIEECKTEELGGEFGKSKINFKLEIHIGESLSNCMYQLSAISIPTSKGRTSLVFLNVTEGCGAYIAAKQEHFQPTCSIKDRPAIAMIADAVKKGLTTPEKCA